MFFTKYKDPSAFRVKRKADGSCVDFLSSPQLIRGRKRYDRLHHYHSPVHIDHLTGNVGRSGIQG